MNRVMAHTVVLLDRLYLFDSSMNRVMAHTVVLLDRLYLFDSSMNRVMAHTVVLLDRLCICLITQRIFWPKIPCKEP